MSKEEEFNKEWLSKATDTEINDVIKNVKGIGCMCEIELSKRKTSEFDDKLGKFYQTSSTTMVQIHKIDEIAGNKIHFDGICIMDGIRYSNEFSIDLNYSGSVDLSTNKEVCRADFLKFMREGVASAQNKLFKQLK